MKGTYVLWGPPLLPMVYDEAAQRSVKTLIDLYWPFESGQGLLDRPEVLEPADVLLTGWGCPRLDAKILDAAPNLKAIFYAAGTVEPIVSDALWDRDILVTCANDANAIPVADFTVAEVIFSLKRGWFFQRQFAERRDGAETAMWRYKVPHSGTYGSVVGVVSLGGIGRRVCELLKAFEVRVIAHDPYVGEADAASLGVTMCGLNELFREADVVSLHTPLLDTTRGLVTGSLIGSMKQHATLINTARGGIIDEAEMIEELERRQDLTAVLDVTETEPIDKSSTLFDLPNVVLTPHIAGSQMMECQRMGGYMVGELDRYVRGQPLKYRVDKAAAERMGMLRSQAAGE